jgi:hypothetical protein
MFFMFFKGRVMKSLAIFPVLVSLFCLSGCAGVSSGEKPLFMNPPEYVGIPDVEHAVTNRAFQGIPSLAATAEGRLWAAWYASITPGEDQNNYIVLSTSGDHGATWREVLIVDPDGEGPVRAFDPEVWMAPDGNLRLTWSQDIRGRPGNPKAHDGSVAGVWVLEITNADSENPGWKKPVRAADGIMMCKPLVLSTGEWVLPVSTWARTDHSAKMVVSEDLGRTWFVRGGCNVPVKDRSFDEHMFIERRDKTIWMLARTKYGIGESISVDRGVTWAELKRSSILHTSARFFIRRLNSGNLLLIKHGPLDQQTGRSHLTAYVSLDDGKSWTGGLLLDERKDVSYPDGQQTADGTIHIIYDYQRTDAREILMAEFQEEDVVAGASVSGDVQLRRLVSQASMDRLETESVPHQP